MLTFGRKGSSDVLMALREKAVSFTEDSLNSELANQCAIDAWCLCDWVFNEYSQKLDLSKLSDFQEAMKEKCPALALFQDVANASKHMIITKYIPRLSEAKEHNGVFDHKVFSSAFDVSALILVAKDGSEIRFGVALEEVIRTWEYFFDVHDLRIS